MCYCGCGYENRNGGCGKPFNKICPQIADEIKDKEEKMNVKEFKSEEQLRFLIEGYGLSDMQKNSIVSAFKEAGLIRKSELHQKVKEAERMNISELEQQNEELKEIGLMLKNRIISVLNNKPVNDLDEIIARLEKYEKI